MEITAITIWLIGNNKKQRLKGQEKKNREINVSRFKKNYFVIGLFASHIGGQRFEPVRAAE